MKCLEHQIQSLFFNWIRWQRKDLEPFIFAIPNGGWRHPAVARKLKEEGVKAGVFDVFVAIPNHSHAGLWIEMKAGKNKLTEAQEVFMRNMLINNYDCVICYSLEEAQQALKDYLGE